MPIATITVCKKSCNEPKAGGTGAADDRQGDDMNRHELNETAKPLSERMSAVDPSGYTQHSISMAQAIQNFRNLSMLRDLTELRGTKEYYDLCETWEAFDDATQMKHRV